MRRPKTRTIVFLLLAVSASVWGGFAGLSQSTEKEPLERVAYVAFYAFVYFDFLVIPGGILLLALIKSRELKRETEEMDDALKIDPDGEEKLRNWIASKQSLEAQIGLVERTHDHDKVNVLRDLPDDDPRGKGR